LITLTEGILDEIRREGEKSYPNECCGALYGKIGESGEKIAEFITPMLNAREEGEQYHRFRIDPDDYLKAELFAAENGLDLLGFYHSHPDHPANPSEYDRVHALPFHSYVIAAVSAGIAGEVTSWELSSDRTHFIKEL
jgi:proteasome lid subunit RPN8/RPN11